MTSHNDRRHVLGALGASALLIVLVGVGFGIDGGAGSGLLSAGILAAYVAVVWALRNRSTTAEILSLPRDERGQRLYERAGALTSAVLAAVMPGWFIVSLITGNPADDVGTLCLVFAVVFIGSVVLVQRRA